jgi:hypothetical protein
MVLLGVTITKLVTKLLPFYKSSIHFIKKPTQPISLNWFRTGLSIHLIGSAPVYQINAKPFVRINIAKSMQNQHPNSIW